MGAARPDIVPHPRADNDPEAQAPDRNPDREVAGDHVAGVDGPFAREVVGGEEDGEEDRPEELHVVVPVSQVLWFVLRERGGGQSRGSGAGQRQRLERTDREQRQGVGGQIDATAPQEHSAACGLRPDGEGGTETGGAGEGQDGCQCSKAELGSPAWIGFFEAGAGAGGHPGRCMFLLRFCR